MPKMNPGLSLWALNNYLEEDGGVFKDVQLTERLTLNTCIDNILERWGTCDLIITDPRIVVRRTQLFFLKNYDNFDKMAKALLAEYNPIENYDRHEDTDETRDIEESGEYQAESSSSASSSGSSSSETGETIGEVTTEHTVSAMNVSTYQPSNQDATTEHSNSSTTEAGASEESSASGSESGGNSKTVGDDFNRTSHIHGNIGVTTSQQMIESELELRKFNIYDYIADLYAEEFLYRIW